MCDSDRIGNFHLFFCGYPIEIDVNIKTFSSNMRFMKPRV